MKKLSIIVSMFVAMLFVMGGNAAMASPPTYQSAKAVPQYSAVAAIESSVGFVAPQRAIRLIGHDSGAVLSSSYLKAMSNAESGRCLSLKQTMASPVTDHQHPFIPGYKDRPCWTA